MAISFLPGITGLITKKGIDTARKTIHTALAGAKGSRPAFEDVLNQLMIMNSESVKSAVSMPVNSTGTSHNPGTLTNAGQSTNLTIGGKGFFIVRSPEAGETRYTRTGQFGLNPEGRLVSPSGDILQGKLIDPATKAPYGLDMDIVIPADVVNPHNGNYSGTLEGTTVSAEGIVSGKYTDGQVVDFYQITLANFNSTDGLKKEAGNYYSETIKSGVSYTNAPGEGGLGRVVSNPVEKSAVNLSADFMNLMKMGRK